MIVQLIVACEVLFWVFLGSGLVARYPLGRPTLGAALLLCAPLVDVVLLVAAAVDLRTGGVASWSHGLAAAYIGFSVAFGHSIIRWADAHFVHRFAHGRAPTKPARYGRARAAREWREFGKALIAWGVACGLLAAIGMVGDPHRTEALSDWIRTLSVALGVWGVIALSYTVFPARERARLD